MLELVKKVCEATPLSLASVLPAEVALLAEISKKLFKGKEQKNS